MRQANRNPAHPARTIKPGLAPAARLLSVVALAALIAGIGWGSPCAARSVATTRVLLITAHPDDETLFNLGRFRERGWRMAVALVTNGEQGSVVQGIRQDYDPARDEDILYERAPGPGVRVTRPPVGPRLREITTPRQLARQRRREFLASMATHRVAQVFFLSTLGHPDFVDGWEIGIQTWNQALLRSRLSAVTHRYSPDIVITLNPDEVWAHPQHQGLGRLVRQWHREGMFDRQDGSRPPLYGLREHGWYTESRDWQAGDEDFDRLAASPVLRRIYDDYWRKSASTYLSQSSHPVWFDARVSVGLLPGYGALDRIRRLDCTGCPGGLSERLTHQPPQRRLMNRLPRQPRVHHLSD